MIVANGYALPVTSDSTISRRRLLAAGIGASAAVSAGWLASSPTASARPQQCSVRYPGYRGHDLKLPYAKYFRPHTAPALPHVVDAFHAKPVAAGRIPAFERITGDLTPTGYSPIETGYGQTAAGITWVAVHTRMPDVTAAMWDWWFGWHSSESARYKLWHPDAHQYAAIERDLTTARIPDRAKYIGNTSYVDEYIGPKLQQLAIGFRDPVAHGFDVPAGHTVIFGRVGNSIAPVDLGWLAHQVRPTPEGCEMRSRFYLNVRGLHTPNLAQAACAIARGPSADPRDTTLGLDVGRDLLMHCGQEMHHLAGFLPELYREFA